MKSQFVPKKYLVPNVISITIMNMLRCCNKPFNLPRYNVVPIYLILTNKK
jgi:hypothetical protein